MATFLPACQILSGNSSQSLRVLIVPHFFLSHICSLDTLFPPLLFPSSTTHPPHARLPPSSRPRPPSPIPLSQLPVELATLQDLADGSVISSASLPSLFSSPFFFSLFSPLNQITEENFSSFGFEFCRYIELLSL